MAGRAIDISVSKNGKIFAIGVYNGIHYWNDEHEKWIKIEGSAVKIIPGPIVLNENGSLFKYKGKKWSRIPGKMSEIAIGVNG